MDWEFNRVGKVCNGGGIGESGLEGDCISGHDTCHIQFSFQGMIYQHGAMLLLQVLLAPIVVQGKEIKVLLAFLHLCEETWMGLSYSIFTSDFFCLSAVA